MSTGTRLLPIAYDRGEFDSFLPPFLCSLQRLSYRTASSVPLQPLSADDPLASFDYAYDGDEGNEKAETPVLSPPSGSKRPLQLDVDDEDSLAAYDSERPPPPPAKRPRRLNDEDDGLASTSKLDDQGISLTSPPPTQRPLPPIIILTNGEGDARRKSQRKASQTRLRARNKLLLSPPSSCSPLFFRRLSLLLFFSQGSLAATTAIGPIGLPTLSTRRGSTCCSEGSEVSVRSKVDSWTARRHWEEVSSSHFSFVLTSRVCSLLSSLSFGFDLFSIFWGVSAARFLYVFLFGYLCFMTLTTRQPLRADCSGFRRRREGRRIEGREIPSIAKPQAPALNP